MNKDVAVSVAWLRMALMAWVVLFGLGFVVYSPHTVADIDIRASRPISSGNSASFNVHIKDCRERVSVDVGREGELTRYSPANMNRNLADPLSCEISFQLDSAASLEALVVLNFLDDSTQSYTETFFSKRVGPKVSLFKVSFQTETERQFLDILLNAQDDQDIAYLPARVQGFRASVLRSVGGVLSEAWDLLFCAQIVGCGRENFR
ncbi:hypothetical protein [uncultured Microbulbifer sp.]|uniref:hypothetical protein n=1 Tax=uncultured Microbulbifer sp. TaxID=348147 RepID=UPI002622FBB8|nr:hypothetical protein [uncultured Microbulbifer sp.]